MARRSGASRMSAREPAAAVQDAWRPPTTVLDVNEEGVIWNAPASWAPARTRKETRIADDSTMLKTPNLKGSVVVVSDFGCCRP
jgi:hypothetical protein